MPIKINIALPANDESQYTFEFDQGEILLGRGPQCDVQLPFPFISSHHLTILIEGGGAFLVADAGSTNGSRLNGTRLAPDNFVPLEHDARLLLGDELEVHIEFTDVLERSLSLDESSEQVRKMVWETLSASGSHDEVTLEVVRGPDIRKRFTLNEEQGVFMIGCGEACDFHLTDPQVYDEHFEIFRQGYGYWARPLHEQVTKLTNQQLSSCVLLQAQPLNDEARIEIGQTELRFFDPLQDHLEDLAALPPETCSAPEQILETIQLEVTDSAEALGPGFSPPDRPPVHGQLKLDLPQARATSRYEAVVDTRSWGLFEILIVGFVVIVAVGGLIALLLLFDVI